MQPFRMPFQVIRANLRSYLLLNALAYGLFLIGFALGLIFRDLAAARSETLENDGTADLVLSLISNPWAFAGVILLVNVFQLSLLTIVLPSLIIPFGGTAAFAVWVVVTGVTLVPANEAGWVALIPHSLTLVIEVQAYVLLLLGVFLLGKYWVRPATVGARDHRRGYLRGLKRLGQMAVPAFVLLVIGALWEAFSLIYLVYPLQTWLL